MRRLTVRVLSQAEGVCAACKCTAVLRVTESRTRRGVTDLLDRSFHVNVLRVVTCLTCGGRYPIRSTDTHPSGATQRPSRASGRDWNYSPAA